MTTTLIILVVTAVFFVWGKIRSDIVALSSLLALVLTGILTPEEALSGFSNSVVIMIAALFIVGGAIFQTGIAGTLSARLLHFAGKSNYKLFLLLMLVTSLIGSFLSNTGTVALLMPIVVTMASTSALNVRRLLMPMAFASSIGGMMTLIGTPPVLIVHGALIESGQEGLSFFTTLPVGMILLVISILLLWPLTKILDKKGKKEIGDNRSTVKSPGQLASEYRLSENMYRVEVKRPSPMIGKTIAALDITKRFAVTIVEIRRRSASPLIKTITQELPEAGRVMAEGDILYLIGDFENVQTFVSENELTFTDQMTNGSLNRPVFSGRLKFDEIGMAEVVVLANSQLTGRLVKDSGFRQNYDVNIIGIQRKDQHLLQDVKDIKMQSGDMLLVQGTWEDIDRLGRLEAEVVVIGQPAMEASKVTLRHKAPVAGGIMILMVLAMVFNILPPVIAVLLAAVAMILTRCFRTVGDAYRTISWESVFLFAAMIPMAVAMEKTGVSEAIAAGIVEMLGSYGPYMVLAGIYLGTSLLTMFISNTATAVLFAPIALQAALTLGVSPYPFVITVAVAASMCLASPFSTPPNAMVMSVGRYSFMDYVKVGLPLQLIYMAVMIIVLPLLFPF